MFFFSISTYDYIPMNLIMQILIVYYLRYQSPFSRPVRSRLRPTAPPWFPPTDRFLNDHDRRTFVKDKMGRHDNLEPIRLRRGVEKLQPIRLPLLEDRHFAFGGINPSHTETILVQPNRVTGRNPRNGEQSTTVYGLGWLICTTLLVPFIENNFCLRDHVDQARQYWQRLERRYQRHRPVRSAEFSYRRSTSPRRRGLLYYGYKIRGWRFCRHCHLPSPLSRRPRRRGEGQGADEEYREDGSLLNSPHWLSEMMAKSQPRIPEREESVDSEDSGYSRCTDCAEAESYHIADQRRVGRSESEGGNVFGDDDRGVGDFDTVPAEAGSTRGDAQ